MRGLIVAAALLVTGSSEPVPKGASPVHRLRIEVENYSGRNCSFVTVARADAAEIARIDDGCRGWSVEDCDGMLFFRTGAVRTEQGLVVRSPDEPPIDIALAIDSALGARSPPQEFLHLRFGRARCRTGGLELPFEGSRIGRGANGAAAAMAGIVRLGPGGNPTVDFGTSQEAASSPRHPIGAEHAYVRSSGSAGLH